jgi:hypothetical protein
MVKQWVWQISSHGSLVRAEIHAVGRPHWSTSLRYAASMGRVAFKSLQH